MLRNKQPPVSGAQWSESLLRVHVTYLVQGAEANLTFKLIMAGGQQRINPHIYLVISYRTYKVKSTDNMSQPGQYSETLS